MAAGAGKVNSILKSESMSIEVLIDLSARSMEENLAVGLLDRVGLARTPIGNIKLCRCSSVFSSRSARGSLVICPATLASKNSCLAGLVSSPDSPKNPMFGGWAFLLHGNLLCGVRRGSLVLRVGRANEDWALSVPGVVPVLMRGRRRLSCWRPCGSPPPFLLPQSARPSSPPPSDRP
jgi:hypothetical protein